MFRVDDTFLTLRGLQFLSENPLFTGHKPNHLGSDARPAVLRSYGVSNLVQK